jgi:hypothetical protein
MHFVALWLDRALRTRVEAAAAACPVRAAWLVEQDPATALEMASGISTLLFPLEVAPLVADPVERLAALAGRDPPRGAAPLGRAARGSTAAPACSTCGT